MTATLIAEPAKGPGNPAPEPKKHFRTDIEGLRAISILGVVLFHAAVPHTAGGFVGVDVFFVISGFLITGLLLREAEQTGAVRLGTFYARRAKRLLPAAALVIVTTAVAAWFMAPLLAVFTAAFDLLWSVFYIGNWRFIQQGNDYLAGNSDYNVALHFWSLAVEEQFYLVWPALIIAAAWLARRLSRDVRATLLVVIAAVSAASFAASLWLTYTNPALAYMATFTRAWQFGAGALLVIVAPAGLRGRWAAIACWLGLAAIVVTIVVYDGTTAYPGWAALLPTLGAAAVIGGGAAGVHRLLSLPPLRLLGRWSYSWYLWHWPVLVLAEVKFGHLDWRVKVGLMIMALGLAGLTYRYVELPVQNSRELRTRVPASAAVGVIATVVATGVVLTVGTRAVDALGSTAGATTAATFEEVFGEPNGANSGNVVPSPIKAREDVPTRPECLIDRTTVQPECLYGVRGGTPVVLFGDSHAHQWLTALDSIALQRKWELHVMTQSGCPVPQIAPRTGETARFSQQYCADWRDDRINDIVDLKPDYVIVSSLNHYIPHTDEVLEDWATSLNRLKASGAGLVYLRDTPYPRSSVPECISSSLDDWSRCAFPVDDSLDPVLTGSLQGVLPSISVVDMNGYLCDTESCPAVRNGILLYRDDSHLSDTAVEALTPALDELMAQKGM